MKYSRYSDSQYCTSHTQGIIFEAIICQYFTQILSKHNILSSLFGFVLPLSPKTESTHLHSAVIPDTAHSLDVFLTTCFFGRLLNLLILPCSG